MRGDLKHRPDASAAADLSGAQETLRDIRAAATRLFHIHGFDATTMRQIAAEVGIEAPSLYNHFASKDELLATLLIDAMTSLLGAVEDGIARAAPDAASQLTAAVRSYVVFHRHHLEAASISDTERRCLKADDAARLVTLRQRLTNLFRGILDVGEASGVFRFEDASIACLCILSVCARLPVWYRADGPLVLDEIATLMARNCLRLAGHQSSRQP